MSVDPWRVYEGLQGIDWTTLDNSQQALVSIGDLRAEVSSGGFSSYLSYSCGDHTEVAVAAAEQAGCPELAALVREGCRIAGFEVRHTPSRDERERLVDDLDVDTFDELDAAFYRLEEDRDLNAVMRYYLDVR
jgi:hypothetical protein